MPRILVNGVTSQTHASFFISERLSPFVPLFNCGKMSLTPQVTQAEKRHK